MSLIIEFLLGVYLGLLTGIVPAMVAGGLGFVFKYFTRVTLPGLGVVVLAVAIAGISGGLLGLIDPEVVASPRLMVALVVVMMLSLYAHSQGDKLGNELPRRFSFRKLGSRTLSGDVIFNVGGLGKVEITPFGEISDLEGYPPLPGELRAELTNGKWVFPADLPIEELERRLEDRLRAQYQLTELDITIDTNGRARIAAAPPMGSLSKRVPEGRRAVSIGALVPTGIARGEQVRLLTDDRVIEATVLSAQSDPKGAPPVATDGGESNPIETPSAPQTTGGEGRITVAVSSEEARFLLERHRARVIVLPRGLGLEYEAVRALRKAGNRFKRQVVSSAIVGVRVDALETDTGINVLALRRQERPTEGSRGWSINPDRTIQLALGDELIAIGDRSAIEAFEARLT